MIKSQPIADTAPFNQALMVRALGWLVIALLTWMGGCLWHTRPQIEPYGPWTK